MILLVNGICSVKNDTIPSAFGLQPESWRFWFDLCEALEPSTESGIQARV